MDTAYCRNSTVAVLLVGVPCGLLCGQHALAAGRDTPPVTEQIICTQVPLQSTVSSAPCGREATRPAIPNSSRIVIFDPAKGPGGVTVLTEGFAAAGKPDLSFDAKRMLFVGKRSAGGTFDVWEMQLDGTGVRQVTHEKLDCMEAIYLSTIYTIDAVRPERRIAYIRHVHDGPGGALFTCGVGGTGSRRITFGRQPVSDPLLISDGRLLFSRAMPGADGADRAQQDNLDLFTVNVDGTGLFPFRLGHDAPGGLFSRCEMDGGEIVYVEQDDAGTGRAGRLVLVPRTASLSAAPDVITKPDGLYAGAAPLSDGRLAVSYQPESDRSYGIQVLDPASRRRVGVVLDTPDWHETDPIALRPRPVPAGRASTVDDRMTTGQLFCLDAYISDSSVDPPVTPGAIKALRVFMAKGDDTSDGQGGASGTESPDKRMPKRVDEKLLGRAEVEDDGSFYVEVPARTPLRLEMLDGTGHVLRSMRSWIWVMPGERRGCIGCHENRALAPPNRHVAALRRQPDRLGLDDNVPSPGIPRPMPHGDPSP